jgi:hypothetical protein
MDIKQLSEVFGITKEDIVDRAAALLAKDALSSSPEWNDDAGEFVDAPVDLLGKALKLVESELHAQVKRVLGNSVEAAVEERLRQEMETLLGKEIIPVDIFGEQTGEPTTMRGVLEKRAREFWEIKVDKDGKPGGGYYGGKSRAEFLMEKLMKDTFTDAMQKNTAAIVTAFQAALKADLAKQASEYVDRLIKPAPR